MDICWPKQKRTGFTLLELMVVSAVIAITVGMAVAYGSNKSKPRNQSTDAANEVFAAIQLGRSHAIQSGLRVKLHANAQTFFASSVDAAGDNNGTIGAVYLADNYSKLMINGFTNDYLSAADIPETFFNNRGYLVTDGGQPTNLSVVLCVWADGNCESHFARIDVNVGGITTVTY